MTDSEPRPLRSPDARAVSMSIHHFGTTPYVVACAPGRVNIIGEHIDYNGGSVLPMAIDRECAVAVSAARGGRWCIASEHAGAEPWPFPKDLLAGTMQDARTALPPGDWRRYVVGVIACMLREETPGQEPAPLELSIASDVPLGAGLSSSAALEVAIARALYAAWGLAWNPLRAAAVCRTAEREFAGVPCGVMDQIASAAGKAGHALRIDCTEPVVVRPVGVPEGASFLVINTRVKHSLGTSEYPLRVAATAHAAHVLGARWLCSLTEADVHSHAGLLGEERSRLALHCVREQSRVLRAIEAMGRGDLTLLGALMTESHASLRDDFRVSCTELDAAVDAACAAPGVLGARMTGGGFGGCAIALVQRGVEQRAAEAIRRRYARTLGSPPDVFPVRPSEGARVISP